MKFALNPFSFNYYTHSVLYNASYSGDSTEMSRHPKTKNCFWSPVVHQVI